MKEWMTQFTLYQMIDSFMKDNPDFFFTNIFDFCKDKGWAIIPYTNKDKELTKISKDGYSFFENNRFAIFYNSDKPETRQKFTIAHEIGHIIMYHHIHVPTQVLLKGKDCKGVWEFQADTFAQNVLFPTELADNFRGHRYYSIAKHLGVSQDMVKVRYDRLYGDKLWFRKIKNM